WEALDGTRAPATMRCGGLEAPAVFTVDEHGRVVGMRAERYLGGGADATLTPRDVAGSEVRRLEGIEVPSRGDEGGAPASGYRGDYRGEILDVHLNRAELYGRESAHRERALEPVARSAPSRSEGASG